MPDFINTVFMKEQNDQSFDENKRITDEDLLEIDQIIEGLVPEKFHDLSNLSGKRRFQKVRKKEDGESNQSIAIKKQIPIGSLALENDSTEETKDGLSEQEDATKFFLDYFVKFGEPDNDDEFNFEHINNLCQSGADVNKRDMYGQSVMHEVARSFCPDVVLFLKMKGVDIDSKDNWGRTPLMVAVATNYVTMVRWLLENGADINHRTKREGLKCIHIAMRYCAIDVFEVLMEFGCSPLEKDFLKRTPFHHAAEVGDRRSCMYLLDMDLPVATFDQNGVSILDHLLNNCHSDIYTKALDQYISSPSKSSANLSIHLNCLTKSRFNSLLLRKKEMIPKFRTPSILEIVTERKEYDAVIHPVITNLLKMKGKVYGNRYIFVNILLNVLFTLLWTIAASIRINDGTESVDKDFILVVTLLSQLVTFIFMFKLFIEWKATRDFHNYEKMRLENDIFRSIPSCHPRWIKDVSTIERRKEALAQPTPSFFNDGWVFIEVLCLLLSCVYTGITVAWFLNVGKEVETMVRIYYSAFFVLVVWIRLNRCFLYHETFGPFIEMLGECVLASAQIGFLFIDFFLPLAVAFWVFFGGLVEHGEDTEYFEEQNLLYQLWLITVIGDYDLDTILSISHIPAQLLVGLFLFLISIITVNVYIALLSAVFARIYANSLPRTYIEEAKIYVLIERIFPHVERYFGKYVDMYCSPASVSKNLINSESPELNPLTVINEALNTTRAMKSSMKALINEETTAQKDLDVVEKAFREFSSKYSAANTLKISSRVRAWMDMSKRSSTQAVIDWFEAMKTRIGNRTSDQIEQSS